MRVRGLLFSMLDRGAGKLDGFAHSIVRQRGAEEGCEKDECRPVFHVELFGGPAEEDSLLGSGESDGCALARRQQG